MALRSQRASVCRGSSISIPKGESYAPRLVLSVCRDGVSCQSVLARSWALLALRGASFILGGNAIP